VHRARNAVRALADNGNMPISVVATFLAFIAATLYIMRRRVRQGRRKASF